MMKKAFLLLITVTGAILMQSCSSTKPATDNAAMFEILTQQNDGGANIRFFEILSEPNEITMLQNDEHLRKKIKPGDIDKANFIILNLGEKPTGGYAITVENVEELDNIVVVTVKETTPDPGAMVSQVISYPYTVVKVNSKKQIVIK